MIAITPQWFSIIVQPLFCIQQLFGWKSGIVLLFSDWYIHFPPEKRYYKRHEQIRGAKPLWEPLWSFIGGKTLREVLLYRLFNYVNAKEVHHHMLNMPTYEWSNAVLHAGQWGLQNVGQRLPRNNPKFVRHHTLSCWPSFPYDHILLICAAVFNLTFFEFDRHFIVGCGCHFSLCQCTVWLPRHFPGQYPIVFIGVVAHYVEESWETRSAASVFFIIGTKSGCELVVLFIFVLTSAVIIRHISCSLIRLCGYASGSGEKGKSKVSYTCSRSIATMAL